MGQARDEVGQAKQVGKLRARDWIIAIVGAGAVLAVIEGDAMDWPLYIAMLAAIASCWALVAVLRFYRG